MITVKTKDGSYPVYTERGSLKRAAEIISAESKVFIVTDDGVPDIWKSILKEQFPDAGWFEFRHGESSKNMDTYHCILSAMLKAHVSRKDTLIALGGGVVGDMAGFAAATYMRGIRFVNIPTTTLSQIDSSIGGKTAIDLDGVKNCVGAFWQPSVVIADPQTLSTLPKRHVSNGLAEAVKAGIIGDPKLFELFERDDYMDHLEELIERALLVKKAVVEEDEREGGLRKILNFGHTLGHAYESLGGLEDRLHGECVAMGMMAITEDPELKKRLAAVLKRLDLPAECNADPERLIELVQNDKKADHGKITIVRSDRIGRAYLSSIEIEDLRRILEK